MNARINVATAITTPLVIKRCRNTARFLHFQLGIRLGKKVIPIHENPDTYRFIVGAWQRQAPKERICIIIKVKWY